MMFENWMHNSVTRFGFKFQPNTFNEQINTQDIIFCFALFFLEGGEEGDERYWLLIKRLI